MSVSVTGWYQRGEETLILELENVIYTKFIGPTEYYKPAKAIRDMYKNKSQDFVTGALDRETCTGRVKFIWMEDPVVDPIVCLMDPDNWDLWERT